MSDRNSWLMTSCCFKVDNIVSAKMQKARKRHQQRSRGVQGDDEGRATPVYVEEIFRSHWPTSNRWKNEQVMKNGRMGVVDPVRLGEGSPALGLTEYLVARVWGFRRGGSARSCMAAGHHGRHGVAPGEGCRHEPDRGRLCRRVDRPRSCGGQTAGCIEREVEVLLREPMLRPA